MRLKITNLDGTSHEMDSRLLAEMEPVFSIVAFRAYAACDPLLSMMIKGKDDVYAEALFNSEIDAERHRWADYNAFAFGFLGGEFVS